MAWTIKLGDEIIHEDTSQSVDLTYNFPENTSEEDIIYTIIYDNGICSCEKTFAVLKPVPIEECVIDVKRGNATKLADGTIKLRYTTGDTIVFKVSNCGEGPEPVDECIEMIDCNTTTNDNNPIWGGIINTDSDDNNNLMPIRQTFKLNIIEDLDDNNGERPTGNNSNNRYRVVIKDVSQGASVSFTNNTIGGSNSNSIIVDKDSEFNITIRPISSQYDTISYTLVVSNYNQFINQNTNAICEKTIEIDINNPCND